MSTNPAKTIHHHHCHRHYLSWKGLHHRLHRYSCPYLFLNSSRNPVKVIATDISFRQVSVVNGPTKQWKDWWHSLLKISKECKVFCFKRSRYCRHYFFLRKTFNSGNDFFWWFCVVCIIRKLNDTIMTHDLKGFFFHSLLGVFRNSNYRNVKRVNVFMLS